MKLSYLSAGLLSGLLTISAANAQTEPPAADPHHSGDAAASDTQGAAPAASPDARTAEMMSPGTMQAMMQMMMQMMAQHHPAGTAGMPAGMGGASGTGDASGMGGAGMGGAGMGGAGMGGPGMMSGTDMSGMGAGAGPEALLGLAPAAAPEMTPEKVRAWVQERLDLLGNPRLKLGAVGDGGDGSITAEILTVDGALVQKLAFNRWPGFVRRID